MSRVPEIAKKLVDHDPVLINEWRGFYRALGLGPAKLAQLEYRFRTATIEMEDLFIEIINGWVSKSGSEASITTLVELLRESGYVSSSELIKKTFGSNLIGNNEQIWLTDPASSNFTMEAISSPLSSSPKLPQRSHPTWYKVEKANADFQGRTEQLSLISNYFNNQISSGQSARVYLSGPESAGKTELAKKFTAKFHQDENANCIWIDGNRASVQKSFTRFVETVLPSNLLSDSPTKISAVVSLLQEHVFKNSQNSWLFVFDAIDDSESVQFLSSILKQFSKFPPVQDPLILMTSQNQIGDPNILLNHWTENNFKHLSLHITSLSGRLVKYCLNDQGDMIRHVMYRLASVFDSFIGKNQKEEKRVKLISLSVSLISLVAYFVTDNISESYLLNIWASLINQPDTKSSDMRDILDRFRTTLGIFLRQPGNSNALDCPKPAVVAVFRQILVTSDQLRKYLGRAISISPITEESVIQKIFVIVLRNYKDNANSDNESGQNVKNLVNKVLHDDALLKLCGVGVSNYACASNDVPLLSQVYEKFDKFFVKGHDETMAVLGALVVALMKQSDYANAAEKCRTLYALARRKYGVFHDTTYAAYTNLVQCYKVINFEAGIKLREEMVAAFEADFGPNNIRTIEERYNLAVTFGDKDPAKCKKRLSDLAPICKMYHFALYQKMEAYLNQPSGTKTKLMSWLN